MIDKINTAGAPKPSGPYSHAIKLGNLVFASGQLPTDPSTGTIVEVDIEAQTKQVLENLKMVLEAAGTDLNHTLKVSVYIIDKKKNFEKMNQVYGRYIKSKPARTTIDTPYIKELPLGALVEIDAIAYIETEGG